MFLRVWQWFLVVTVVAGGIGFSRQLTDSSRQSRQSSHESPWLRVPDPPSSHKGDERAWVSWLLIQLPGDREEFVLPDGSRVDLIFDGVAWEVEHAEKWKEAVGQSLLYSMLTGKPPGIILLKKGRNVSDEEYLRCAGVCNQHGIRLRVVDVTNPSGQKRN